MQGGAALARSGFPLSALKVFAGSRLNKNMSFPNDPDHLADDDHFRSRYVRELLSEPEPARMPAASVPPDIPKVIVQFWDDSSATPADVSECLDSWRVAARPDSDFSYILFDDASAEEFIARELGRPFAEAFDRCPHPAMRSDYPGVARFTASARDRAASPRTGDRRPRHRFPAAGPDIRPSPRSTLRCRPVAGKRGRDREALSRRVGPARNACRVAGCFAWRTLGWWVAGTCMRGRRVYVQARSRLSCFG
jgi:hypothetical protein